MAGSGNVMLPSLRALARPALVLEGDTSELKLGLSVVLWTTVLSPETTLSVGRPPLRARGLS